jgi:hypothetical protein
MKRYEDMEKQLTEYNKALSEGKKGVKPNFDIAELIEFRKWQQERLASTPPAIKVTTKETA